MRRFVALVAVCAVTLVPASAAVAAPAEGAGTARTDLDLLSFELDVTGPLAELLDAVEALQLASATSFASLDADAHRNALGAGKPFARSALGLPVVGEIEARSDGTSRHGGEEIVLPAGLGNLKVGGLLATVENDEARALVDALAGRVGMLVGGLSAQVPGDGKGAIVGASTATAAHGAVVEDLNLALGDLLPAELLALLPLDVILDLVGALPLDAGGLGDAVDHLRGIQTQAAQLNALREEVVDVIVRLSEVLAPADTALATGAGLDADALADLITALDVVLGDLDALLDTIAGGLEEILAHLAVLDLDLEGLLRQVVDNLAGLELVALDRLGVTVDARASGDSSLAEVECAFRGVRVLGVSLPEVDTCPELRRALDDVQATLLGALAALPVAGAVTGDLVRIDGLRASTTPDDATAEGYQHARAALTGLDLRVASLDLAPTVDGLVEGLLDELEALLELIEGDLLAGLGLPGTGASDADLDALLRNLLGAGVPRFDVGLDRLIGGLDGVRASGSGE